MNTTAHTPDAPEPPPLPEYVAVDSPLSPPGRRDVLRRLLVCNPFFLASAALLLFGLNRLSVDPGFLAREESKLLFNVSTLQLYGLLLVGTAVVLARRRIWYDSALLVVLDSGLLLAPFLFISQAALIDRTLAGWLTVIGALLATARLAAVRRWYPEFNLPLRLLALGLVMLVANVALIFVSRRVMETTFENWAGPNTLVWTIVLPLLALGANALPRPARHDVAAPMKPWLPLLLFALWLAGTGVHAWCVAWICELPLLPHHLAPTASMMVWTVWNRFSDCAAHEAPRARVGFLALSFAAVALAYGEREIFLPLAALNLAVHTLLLARNVSLRSVLRITVPVAAAMLLSGLPLEWLLLHGAEPRGEMGGVAVVALLLWFAAGSRRPQMGLLGAGLVALAAMQWGVEETGHFSAQLSLLFLMGHSLRWTDAEHPGAGAFRIVAALGWVMNTAWWTHSPEWWPTLVSSGGALVVLALWFLSRLRGGPPLLSVPVTAGLVIASGPGNWLVQEGSSGVLSVLGSGVLFLVGLLVAWRRPRTVAPARPATETD